MADSEIPESFGVCRRTPSDEMSNDHDMITRIPYGDAYELFTYNKVDGTNNWRITLPWHDDESQERQDIERILEE